MQTLHILNGDATLYIFTQTPITGDVLIWREILSDGPVTHTNLWGIRSEWIQQTFGEDPLIYQQKVIKEVEKLNQISKYTEIILWFEYDLVCQINLSYILSILNKKLLQKQTIYLICPDSFPNKPNFKGLGELNAQELYQLYSSRILLDESDLTVATTAWDLYVANVPKQIQEFLMKDFGKLILLKKALKAHLLRFPKQENQLNHIEETILAIIQTGIIQRPKIYEAFWMQESIYGMTDFQIDLVLAKLKKSGLISNEI